MSDIGNTLKGSSWNRSAKGLTQSSLEQGFNRIDTGDKEPVGGFSDRMLDADASDRPMDGEGFMARAGREWKTNVGRN